MLNNKSYITYLPEYLQQVVELNEIGNLMDIQLLTVSELENNILQENYVDTAQDYGLERLEKMLGIENNSTNVEVRRKQILTRFKGEAAYTFDRVYEKLISICGAGNVTMEYSSTPYTLDVKIGVKGVEYIHIVEAFLKEVVPANIYINCSIIYNTHSEISRFTHEYLHRFKNRIIKEGVVE